MYGLVQQLLNAGSQWGTTRSKTRQHFENKGVFTPSTARQYLKRKLAERVGDRQELLIPTGESPFKTASLNHS